MSTRIALFIDAENISYRYFPKILQEVRNQGEIIIARVFADWDKSGVQGWKEVAKKYKLELKHQTSRPKAKNETDIRLSMEAALILTDDSLAVDVICVVANDSDYVPLCDISHEYGKRVIGIGYNEKQTSEVFIDACDHFILILSEKGLEISVNVPSSLPTEIKPLSPQKQKQLKQILTKTFKQALLEANGWITLSQLGKIFSQLGLKYDDYGYKNLKTLLESQSGFIELRVTGTATSARLRNQKHSQKQLQGLVKKAFAKSSSDKGGWVILSELQNTLCWLHHNFVSKEHGYKTLTKLLESMPDLVEFRNKNNVKLARIKNKATSNKVAVYKPKNNKTTNDRRLLWLIHTAIEETSSFPEDWVTLLDLSKTLCKFQSDFTSKKYGHKTLIKLLGSMPDLVEIRTQHNTTFVRLKK